MVLRQYVNSFQVRSPLACQYKHHQAPAGNKGKKQGQTQLAEQQTPFGQNLLQLIATQNNMDRKEKGTESPEEETLHILIQGMQP